MLKINKTILNLSLFGVLLVGSSFIYNYQKEIVNAKTIEKRIVNIKDTVSEISNLTVRAINKEEDAFNELHLKNNVLKQSLNTPITKNLGLFQSVVVDNFFMKIGEIKENGFVILNQIDYILNSRESIIMYDNRLRDLIGTIDDGVLNAKKMLNTMSLKDGDEKLINNVLNLNLHISPYLVSSENITPKTLEEKKNYIKKMEDFYRLFSLVDLNKFNQQEKDSVVMLKETMQILIRQMKTLLNHEETYLRVNNVKPIVIKDLQTYKNKVNQTYLDLSIIQENIQRLFWLLIVLMGITIVGVLIVINSSKDMSKKDEKDLKDFDKMRKQLKATIKNIELIVNSNKTINTNLKLNEYRDSYIGVITNKFNILLSTYSNVLKSLREHNSIIINYFNPLFPKFEHLRKGKNDSLTSNEIKIVEEVIKDVKSYLGDMDKKQDVLNNDLQNLSLNLEDCNGSIEFLLKGFEDRRGNLQSSGKHMKKIGELTQNVDQIQNEISQDLSKIEVIALNLAIDSTESNYSNELKALTNSLANSLNKVKKGLNDIQSISKEATEAVEKSINNLIDDNKESIKLNNKINEGLKSNDKMIDMGNTLFDLIDKINNIINILETNNELLKDKDKSKSELLIEVESRINNIKEAMSNLN